MANSVSRFGVLFAMTVFATLSGCSGKSGSGGSELPQQNGPGPRPTAVPTATPTPHPTPTHPSPRPSHTPSPTPSSSPAPIACDPAALKDFASYGIVAANTATVQGMEVSHGIVATTIKIDGAEIGYGLPKELGRFDLIGDQIDLAFVDVVSGGVAYASKVKFHEGADVYGMTKKATPIDRAALAAKMAALQAKLLALPVTKSAIDCPKDDDCTTTLAGTSPTVNRFTIGAESLKKRAKIVVSVPKHATAIVVIDGANATLKDLDVKAPAETVWTMSQPGGKLTVDFMTLTGVVLAPASTIELDQALLMGRSITKEFVTPPCNDTEAACSTVDSQEQPEKVCL